MLTHKTQHFHHFFALGFSSKCALFGIFNFSLFVAFGLRFGLFLTFWFGLLALRRSSRALLELL